jgi:hypothetical protein
MTEAQLILADLVLLKLPVGRQLDVVGFAGSHLFEGKQIPQPLLDEINKIISSRSDVIRTFLLKEKYIETVNYMASWDVITDKGHKAQELGGHSQYLIWDTKRKKYKKWKEVAFWILFIASVAAGADVFIKWLSKGKSQPSKDESIQLSIPSQVQPSTTRPQTLIPDTKSARTIYLFDSLTKKKNQTKQYTTTATPNE